MGKRIENLKKGLDLTKKYTVKEAVAKAFGTGISPELGWQDVEVVADPATRAPSVRFSPKGQALAARRGVARVLVSLSHTHDYAVAQAILVEDGNQTTDDRRRRAEGRTRNR